MNEKFYTIGELGRLTGVSYKTIRHYHEKGLLEPVKYTESGYKLYSQKSVEVLQRILMLKYLNFPLDEIKIMLHKQDSTDNFCRQEKLLRAQKKHIEQVLLAVEEIQKLSEEEQWDKLLTIIQMTQQKEEIINQYKEENNLRNRINIHTFSTSKTNWYQWVLDGLKLKSGMKILEIGCGNGMLWIYLKDQLPKDLNIIMTDNSEEMLEAAKVGIEEFEHVFRDKNIHFTFLKMDAEEFHIEEDQFDRIIANHMLYHVSNENREKLLKTCVTLLKDDGIFYASTIGKNHMGELFELVKEFDDRIQIPKWMSSNFELENGEEQLRKVFSRVVREEQKNDLLVPNPQAIYDYVESLPGNIKEMLDKRGEECLKFIKERVSESKPYFIHKSTGAFLCKK